MKIFRKKVEAGGKAATIDDLMSSLPTQSQMLVEDVKKETKKQIINHEKLTQKDCRNTRTKRANRIIRQELIDFKDRYERVFFVSIFSVCFLATLESRFFVTNNRIKWIREIQS